MRVIKTENDTDDDKATCWDLEFPDFQLHEANKFSLMLCYSLFMLKLV